MGLERLILLLEQNEDFKKDYDSPRVFIIPIGEKADKLALKSVFDLRCENINAEIDLNGRSVKAQMKYADKLNAKYTLVFGDDEIDNNDFRLKNMETGETVNDTYENIMNYLKENK